MSPASAQGADTISIESHPDDPTKVIEIFELDDPTMVTTSGEDINNNGDIAGYWQDNTPTFHGFIRYADGSIEIIDYPDAISTSVFVINDAQEIAGSYTDIDGTRRMFVRTADGTYHTIPTPIPGGAIREIDEQGRVVGELYDSAAQTITSFQWSVAGGFDDLPPLSTLMERAWATNDNGTIAGENDNDNEEGFVLEADGSLTIFDLGVGNSVEVRGLNNLGQVVGRSFTGLSGDDADFAYIRDVDGSILTFDVPGTGYIGVSAINDAGAVSGRVLRNGAGWEGYVRHPDGTFTFYASADGSNRDLRDLNEQGDVVGRQTGGGINATWFTRAAEQCPTGSFGAAGVEPCTLAPAGSFVDTAGATTATPCPAGSFSAVDGSTACTLAPAGSFVDTAGATAATPCPAGTISDVGATACQAVVTGARNVIIDAIADLEQIAAGTSGQTQEILNWSSVLLERSARDSRWSSDNELNYRRGWGAFTDVAAAVNNIEIIADSTSDAALRAELDQVTASLLDTMRGVAQAKIDEATAAGGTAYLLRRANNNIAYGDDSRADDWLSPAVRYYRNAWYQASRSF